MRFKIIGLCLAAVFVMSAVVATAAQAEEAPFWSRGGSGARLKAGETRDISAKIFSANFTLKSSAGPEIICHAIKLKEGVLLGSNAGEPGTNDEVVEFSSGCEVKSDGTCSIEEPIVTERLSSELVYATNKKQVLTEFKSASGGRLATLHFKGAGCTPVKEGPVLVEGSVAGEVLNSKEEAVELGKEAKEEATGLVRFPTTAIRDVWLIKNGTGKEEGVGLKVATQTATLSGTALILLANSNGESTGELFSALP